ncbi:MAG: carboxyltransferase domain-containing protein [Pseudomonadota bacterium]
MTQDTGFPKIIRLGLTGLLVSFADRLSEPANRAALALGAAIEAEAWDGVAETAPTLASLYLRVDPGRADPDALRAKINALLASRDWLAAPLPSGRKLWRVPCAFGGVQGPQLAEAAALAGCSEAEAITEITRDPVRVLTIGFAPGQPYLGTLPPAWNIPRQIDLTPMVPSGALVVALRQLIIFTAPSPTGWRQIGQTGFQGFRPEAEPAIALRPGDEIQVSAASLDVIEDGDGGVRWELLP